MASLSKTCLHGVHLQLGAQMVSYAGYHMPILYKSQGHVDSHHWVRRNAGLFDVSHMVQHKFRGPAAARFLESVTPSDLSRLGLLSSTLSVFLNDHGGIVDDTIITKLGADEFYVLTNAGCRAKDLEYLRAEFHRHNTKGDLVHEIIDTGALVALQGPQAAAVLQSLVPKSDLSTLKFGQSRTLDLVSSTRPVQVSRCGYTGEDGFELSIPHEPSALSVVQSLLDHDLVRPIGLAARDSLRLEAGMCLYGQELSEDVSPVEAGLSWVVHKTRRHVSSAPFNGKTHIINQITNKPSKLRVGLVIDDAPARAGVPIFSRTKSPEASSNPIGQISSGSPSPTLQKNIAMGYVPLSQTAPGTRLQVLVRGKLRPALVTKLPFVPTRYYK